MLTAKRSVLTTSKQKSKLFSNVCIIVCLVPAICASDTRPLVESTNVAHSFHRVCAICQCDYEDADLLIKLPCTHKFHHGCGSEWLLNYSKLCPVCKHDVTE